MQLCWKEHLASERSEPQSRSDSLFEGRWVPHGTGHFPELVPEQAWGPRTCRLPTLAVGSMLVGLKEHLALCTGRQRGRHTGMREPTTIHPVSALMDASGQRCIPSLL